MRGREGAEVVVVETEGGWDGNGGGGDDDDDWKAKRCEEAVFTEEMKCCWDLGKVISSSPYSL